MTTNWRMLNRPNVAAHRPRAIDARNPRQTQSRGSVQSVCSDLDLSLDILCEHSDDCFRRNRVWPYEFGRISSFPDCDARGHGVRAVSINRTPTGGIRCRQVGHEGLDRPLCQKLNDLRTSEFPSEERPSTRIPIGGNRYHDRFGFAVAPRLLNSSSQLHPFPGGICAVISTCAAADNQAQENDATGVAKAHSLSEQSA
jgi:hypothetical protein